MKTKKKHNESRRNFLKLMGAGGAAVLTASVLPVAKGKEIIYEDVPPAEIPKEAKIVEPILDKPIGKEIPRYLRQEETNRIYVYTDALMERGDMVLLEPALAEKLAEDIKAFQELKASWMNTL